MKQETDKMNERELFSYFIKKRDDTKNLPQLLFHIATHPSMDLVLMDEIIHWCTVFSIRNLWLKQQSEHVKKTISKSLDTTKEKYHNLKKVAKSVKKERDHLLNTCSRLSMLNSELEQKVKQKTNSPGIQILQSTSKENETKIQDLTETITKLKNQLEKRETQNNLLIELIKCETGPANPEKTCARCPERDLCSRRILLVGGMSKFRQVYEKAVSGLKGEFRYHEGTSVTAERLKEKVRWADTVLCPIDVNSHYACTQAKKLCKKMGRRFIILKSSSRSSIERALCEI